MEGFPCEAYYDRIGSNICRLRRERHMTQERLAEAADRHYPTMTMDELCALPPASSRLPPVTGEFLEKMGGSLS